MQCIVYLGCQCPGSGEGPKHLAPALLGVMAQKTEKMLLQIINE